MRADDYLSAQIATKESRTAAVKPGMRRIESDLRQPGFTLIELVTVITIIAVLAGFAIPHFVDLRSTARSSTLQGMMASIRSAAVLANSVQRARQLAPNDPVQMEGQAIAMVEGYPDATSMLLAANLNLNGRFQTQVFGNSAFIIWATGTPAWTVCGLAYVRAIPPTIPRPLYLGPNNTNCL